MEEPPEKRIVPQCSPEDQEEPSDSNPSEDEVRRRKRYESDPTALETLLGTAEKLGRGEASGELMYAGFRADEEKTEADHFRIQSDDEVQPISQGPGFTVCGTLKGDEHGVQRQLPGGPGARRGVQQ